MITNCIANIEVTSILRSLPGPNIFLLPDAPKFTIVEVNEAYTAVSQTTREELLGKGIFEVFTDYPDNTTSKLEANLKRSLLKVLQERVTHEMPVQKYDLRDSGTGKLVEHYWFPKNTPILKDDNSVAFIMHSVVDVTDKILLNQKLNKTTALLENNQLHYHSLFQQNPDAVFSLDLEGRFLSVNSAFQALTACTPEKIHQTNFLSLAAPEDLDKTIFHFNEAVNGNPQSYEAGIVTANGQKRIVNFNILPIIINNKVVGIHGISKDITDFITLQEELLKSNKRFEMVSKVTIDAIWDWNLVTNEISKAGNAFYRSLGYSPAVLQSFNNWVALIHPEDADKVMNGLKESLDNPEIQTLKAKYRIRKADGSYAYILDKGFIVRIETGKAVHIYGASKDITSSKKNKAEKELLIKDLTQSNNYLKQFSYIITHNLRTPIANLIGIGNLIDETRVEDPLTRTLLQKYKQTTEILHENVKELLEILIIKNNLEVPVKETNISNVLAQVVDSISHYVAVSEANIITDFSAGTSVNFNPEYLQSILLNLLTNAIKYRSPDRSLQVKIQTENREGHLFLHFTDNGLGIDLEKYGDKVFGLYQKFHDHPDSKGLGLHLVANQVKAMGGEISIKSKVDNGTTFSIKFKN
ncbi:PAS domain-containing sensor histidine kinase [Adhaeribacter terreus]|uniref:histidine kinase n=1 Tax=Adhaeribacter terreus TaxID=529703 RepID=A0ABW0EDY3_9BACT